ncbi:FtsH protease activity modulator HflK [Desertibaculum subflavum]|uniref:FtsH protease activity modulator HflK n=1 Tax=Desertibaculum subflavum TaxID=2268458 RepID=UPI000E666B1A
MSWNNQGGGGWQSGGRGPWGQGPRGSGPQPPDLEELIRKGQDRLRNLLPGGGFGGPVLWSVVGAGILVLLVFLCAYRVQPDEQGVVLRFGQWVRTTQPGLNFKWPAPIETVLTPKVTRVNRIDVGFRGGDELRSGLLRDVPEESLMLTGDENIVDIDFSVFWQIKDAGLFLFNIQNPEATVKAVAESAMREVIGKNQIQRILTEGRQPIEIGSQQLIQHVLDEYKAGVAVSRVNLQKVDPPNAVIDAFRDVQAAKADRERAQNEAEAYRNDIIPRARGEAERILQAAEAYKQEVVATAQGEAARFLAVYNQYKLAKDVTTKRLYLETMEEVLRGSNKIILDNKEGGVLPYLPLNELQRRVGQPAQTPGTQR